MLRKVEIVIPRIIGHRGACGHAPENTLAAMQVAKQFGLHAVEFDVRLTACNELVIFHDDILDYRTNGKGIVAEHTYEVIAKLDAGSWFKPQFRNSRIMSLHEMLSYLAAQNFWINIDIKTFNGNNFLLAKRLLEILHYAWPSHLPAPLLSSFSVECLGLIKQFSPRYPLGLLLSEYQSQWQAIAESLSCVSIHVAYSALTRSWVDKMRTAGYKVLAYTVNDQLTAETLFAMGVDGIFTDYPDKLLLEFSQTNFGTN